MKSFFVLVDDAAEMRADRRDGKQTVIILNYKYVFRLEMLRLPEHEIFNFAYLELQGSIRKDRGNG